MILAPVLLDVIGPEAEFFGIRATLLVIVVVIGLTSWAATARDHPLAGALDQGADVRGPGAGHRRRVGPDHAPPHPAQRGEPDRGPGGPDLRRRGVHRDDARVHRPRRPGGPVVGRDPQLRPGCGRPGAWCVVVHRPAGGVRRARGARLHACRQRTRRRAQPQVGQDADDGRQPAADGSGRCRSRPCPGAPLLEVEDLSVRFRMPTGPSVKPVDGVELPARRRRGAGHRRRVRLRQDDDGAVARPAAARQRPDQRRQRQAVRHRPRAQDRAASCAVSVARDLDRVPGRDERPQPGAADRRPDRGADRGSPRPAARGVAPAGRRAARAGGHPAPAGVPPTRTSSRAACASAR